MVILADTDWSHGGDKIILRKDVKPSNLRGKPVGVYLNRPSVTYFLSRWLSTAGLKLSDVKPVEMETKPMTDNFISGVFDLIVCYDPEAIRAEKEGKGIAVARMLPKDFAPKDIFDNHVILEVLNAEP